MSNSMPLEDPDIARLKFIRDEVKHEFNLLAMRSTILVTCQSFLVVPFAILNTAQNFLWVTIPAMLICVLGIATTLLIRRPIRTAHQMIDHWLVKQARLLKDKDDEVYVTDRDKKAAHQNDESYDHVHRESLSFSRNAPLAFLIFWILALIWILVRSTATGTVMYNEFLHPRSCEIKSEQSDAPTPPATRVLNETPSAATG
jgi:hypothetical protein